MLGLGKTVWMGLAAVAVVGGAFSAGVAVGTARTEARITQEAADEVNQTREQYWQLREKYSVLSAGKILERRQLVSDIKDFLAATAEQPAQAGAVTSRVDEPSQPPLPAPADTAAVLNRCLNIARRCARALVQADSLDAFRDSVDALAADVAAAKARLNATRTVVRAPSLMLAAEAGGAFEHGASVKGWARIGADLRVRGPIHASYRLDPFDGTHYGYVSARVALF